MAKINSRQEKTMGEKLFIWPKAAIPGGSTGRCLLGDSESDPNSLVL
jgi:hypothetical protein